MGLRKPAFEDQGDTAVAERPVETPVETPAPAEIPEATESKSTAVAATSPTAVVVGGKFKPALGEFENAIDPSNLDFDTFRRITVGLDGFSDQDEVELGKRIRVQLMSWNYRYVLSPGVKNAEADEFVRYSLDGKHIDDTGEDCAEYVKMLREEEGYTEASIKKYVSLYCFLAATEVKGELVDIPAEDREIVTVQVPPRSVAKFTGFQIESGVKVAQKIVPPFDTITLTQKKVAGKSTNYAEILFSVK